MVLNDGQQASEEDLQNHVKSNLARYKVPREIEFIDELPRNPTGKVLKRKLAEPDSEDEEERGGEDGDSAEEGERRTQDEARTEA